MTCIIKYQGNEIERDTTTMTKSLTAFTISLSSYPSTICAGGNVNPGLDICKAEITATTPALSGLPTATGSTFFNVSQKFFSGQDWTSPGMASG